MSRRLHGVWLGVFALAGCYLSHPRGESRGTDAADADVDGDTPISPRASSCRVQCGPPELVAVYEADEDIESLLDTARLGRTVGVLAKYHSGPTFEYALVLFDGDLGAFRAAERIDGLRTTYGIAGGGLHADESTFLAAVVRTTGVGGGPMTVEAGAARWDATGSLLYQGTAGAFSGPLAACGCSQVGAGLGRGSTSYALLARSDAIEAIRMTWSGAGGVVADAPAAFVRLPEDVPGSAPMDGVVLRGGTVVISGGGMLRTGGGTSAPPPRQGFIARGDAEATPFEATTIGGAPSDPPPLVEPMPEGGGFYLFQYASNTADLGESALRVQARDASGAMMDELSLPLSYGLSPVAIDTFASERRAGVVWVDAEGGVHLLPVGGDALGFDRCSRGVEAPPVATLPALAGGMRGLLASADGRDVIVFAIEPTAEGRRLIALRIPACEMLMAAP